MNAEILSYSRNSRSIMGPSHDEPRDFEDECHVHLAVCFANKPSASDEPSGDAASRANCLTVGKTR
jgi:hypothetical protein